MAIDQQESHGTLALAANHAVFKKVRYFAMWVLKKLRSFALWLLKPLLHAKLQCTRVGGFVDPRINDEYYRQLIEMHRARAWLFRWVSMFLLLGTVVLIAVGVATFKRGDPASDLIARQEVDLQGKIGEINEKLRSLSTLSAEAVTRSAQYERAYRLALMLERVNSRLSALLDGPTWMNLETLSRSIPPAEAIVEKLITLPADGTAVIDVSDVYPDDSNRFPVESIKLLQKQLRASEVDSAQLRGNISKLAQLLSELLATRVDNEGGLPEEAKQRLDQFSKSAALQKLSLVKAELLKLKNAADEEVHDSDLRAAEIERTRANLESEKEALETDLKEVQLRRDKLLFMAWLPDLTLRAGVVVLLLFLTQILLSTYRYTLGLSSFYMARSDIIQMLQPGEDGGAWYPIDHCKVLAESFAPDSIKVDAVTDPSGHVTKLVEAWISRKR